MLRFIEMGKAWGMKPKHVKRFEWSHYENGCVMCYFLINEDYVIECMWYTEPKEKRMDL